VHPKGVRYIAQIGRNRHLNTLSSEGISDWIHCIVRNCKARDIEIAD
jgi:hypothetical protein